MNSSWIFPIAFIVCFFVLIGAVILTATLVSRYRERKDFCRNWSGHNCFCPTCNYVIGWPGGSDPCPQCATPRYHLRTVSGRHFQKDQRKGWDVVTEFDYEASKKADCLGVKIAKWQRYYADERREIELVEVSEEPAEDSPSGLASTGFMRNV